MMLRDISNEKSEFTQNTPTKTLSKKDFNLFASQKRLTTPNKFDFGSLMKEEVGENKKTDSVAEEVVMDKEQERELQKQKREEMRRKMREDIARKKAEAMKNKSMLLGEDLVVVGSGEQTTCDTEPKCLSQKKIYEVLYFIFLTLSPPKKN